MQISKEELEELIRSAVKDALAEQASEINAETNNNNSEVDNTENTFDNGEISFDDLGTDSDDKKDSEESSDDNSDDNEEDSDKKDTKESMNESDAAKVCPKCGKEPCICECDKQEMTEAADSKVFSIDTSFEDLADVTIRFPNLLPKKSDLYVGCDAKAKYFIFGTYEEPSFLRKKYHDDFEEKATLQKVKIKDGVVIIDDVECTTPAEAIGTLYNITFDETGFTNGCDFNSATKFEEFIGNIVADDPDDDDEFIDDVEIVDDDEDVEIEDE